MNYKEWEELRKNSSSEYKKKYLAFMFDKSNINNCKECPEASGRYINESGLLCGQYNCWVACHCRGK